MLDGGENVPNPVLQLFHFGKPSQAKVLTGGGDLREAEVDVAPVC